MNKTFHLRILSLKELIFEGDVLSFSGTNTVGDFDILKDHINFISLLSPGSTIRYVESSGKKSVNISISTGVLIFSKNVAKVFIDF